MDNPVHHAARNIIDDLLRLACKPSVGRVSKDVRVETRTYRVMLKVERVKDKETRDA